MVSDLTDDWRALHVAMRASGFRRDRSISTVARYRGTVDVQARPVPVSFDFKFPPFRSFPKLRLDDPARDLPGVVSHIEIDGSFCYIQQGSFVLDPYDPAGSVMLCLDIAKAALERAVSNDLSDEVAAEFLQHWFGAPVLVDALGKQDQRSRLYPLSDSGYVSLLSHDASALNRLGLDRLVVARSKAAATDVSVFKVERPLTFRRGQRQPKTLGAFCEWCDTIEPSLGRRVLREMGDLGPHSRAFLHAPNGTVGVGIELTGAVARAFRRPNSLARYFEKFRLTIPITRYVGERLDADFLFRRNMGPKPNLAGKRIALIGCGTIGSHLAKLLVQAGAGHAEGSLRLFDPQLLSTGNVGRHWLSTQYAGKNKAIACEQELLRLYPGTNVKGFGLDILDRTDLLDVMDFVIDATGDEPTSLALNHHQCIERQRTETPRPTLFVWLFGNGATAQALLVRDQEAACYKCLRPVHGQPWRFYPLPAAYVPEEMPAACGEAPYLPYGPAAPMMAAALAAKMCQDWVADEASPLLRTIRIDKTASRDIEDQDPAQAPSCPACRVLIDVE